MLHLEIEPKKERRRQSRPERSLRPMTDLDKHVAMRIRERRVAYGIKLEDMASQVGISVQQASKYEKGQNRISAGRLKEVADILGVNVGWFFEGSPVHKSGRSRLYSETIEELIAAIADISNATERNALVTIARALGAPAMSTKPKADARRVAEL